MFFWGNGETMGITNKTEDEQPAMIFWKMGM
jgi:hypothetical protein